MFTNFGASNLQVVQYTGPPEKRLTRPKLNKTGACTAPTSTQQLTPQYDKLAEAICSDESVYKASRNVVNSEGSEPDPSVNLLPGADLWRSFEPIDQACALNPEDGSQTSPIEVSDDSDVDDSSIPSLDELIYGRSSAPAVSIDDLNARAPACTIKINSTVDCLAVSTSRGCREPSASSTQRKSSESAQDGGLSRLQSLPADALKDTKCLALGGSSPVSDNTEPRSLASPGKSVSAHSNVGDDVNGGGVVTNDWTDNEAQEWEVKRILDSRITTGGHREFRIRWGSTWEREENLHCPLLLNQFKKRRMHMRPNASIRRAGKLGKDLNKSRPRKKL